MTVSPREQLPTVRERQTQAAAGAAARAVLARKGILAATVSDIAAEAGRSTMVKRAERQGYATDEDPKLIAVALISKLNGFGYTDFHRTIYHNEGGPL